MVSASTVCGTAFGATITVDPGTVGDGCTTTGAGAGCTTTGGGDGCTTTGGVRCTMTSPAHAPPARTVSAMLPASTVRSMRLFIGVPPMGDRLVSVAARRSWNFVYPITPHRPCQGADSPERRRGAAFER